MEEPVRILQVVATLGMGGIENFIMNIYRNIDREKIQFDFLMHTEEKGIFEDEILSLGGKIYRIPFMTKVGHFKYLKELRKFYKSYSQYKIIHSHYNTISGLILREAKKCEIPIRISHSHAAYSKYGLIENIYKNYSKSFINKVSTHRLACSNLAGEWLYTKKGNFKVINNGIEAKKYIFNFEKRQATKKLLNISEEEKIIGHIGRIDSGKNQNFIIDIFYEILKEEQNYKLILIGEGPLKRKLEEKVNKLGIEEKVIFLGIRKDVNNLLQAMDLFLFPSISEGLPVTLVEAQASGIPCFISDSVTKEIDLECNLTEFISLEKNAEEWKKIILNKRIKERKNTLIKIKEKKYDIEENVKEIEKFYLCLNGELKNEK